MKVFKKTVALLLIVTLLVAVPIFRPQMIDAEGSMPTPEQMLAMIEATSDLSFEQLMSYEYDSSTLSSNPYAQAGLNYLDQISPDSQTLTNITSNSLSIVKSLMMSMRSISKDCFPSTDRSDITYYSMLFAMKGMETLYSAMFSGDGDPTLDDVLNLYKNPYDETNFKNVFSPTLSEMTEGAVPINRQFGEIIASYATMRKALSNIYYEGYCFDVVNGTVYDESVYLARAEEVISDGLAKEEEDKSEHYNDNIAAIYRTLARIELNDTGLISDIEDMGPYNHYTCGWWYDDLVEAFFYYRDSTSIDDKYLSNYPITASQVLAIANNISYSEISNLGSYNYEYFEGKSGVSFDNVKGTYPTFAEYLQNGVGELLTAYVQQMTLASSGDAAAAEDVSDFNNHIMLLADIEEYISELTYGNYVVNLPIREVDFSIAAKVATAPYATTDDLSEYMSTQTVADNPAMGRLFDLLISTEISDDIVIAIVQVLSEGAPNNNFIAFGNYRYATGLLNTALANNTINPGEFNLEQTLEMYRILDSLKIYRMEDVTQEKMAAMQTAFEESEVTFPDGSFNDLLNYAAVLFFPSDESDYFKNTYNMSLMGLIYNYLYLEDYLKCVPCGTYSLNLIEGTIAESEMIINGIKYHIITDEKGNKGAEVSRIYSAGLSDDEIYTDYSTDPYTEYTLPELISMARDIASYVSFPITVDDVLEYSNLDTSEPQEIFFNTNYGDKTRIIAFLNCLYSWRFAETYGDFLDRYFENLPLEDYPDTYHSCDDSCLGILYVYQYTKENPLTNEEKSMINYMCSNLGLSAKELYFACKLADYYSSENYDLEGYLSDYYMSGVNSEDHSEMLSRYPTVGSLSSAFKQRLYEATNLRWDNLDGATKGAITLVTCKNLVENNADIQDFFSEMAIRNLVFDLDENKVKYITPCEVDLVIPEQVPGTNVPVIGIGYAAAINDDDLHSVTFPSTLQYISDYAFKGCNLYGGISFVGGGENCKSIGEHAFYIALSEHRNSYYDNSEKKWITEVLEVQPPLELPTGIEYIGYEAFAETSITSIVWPEDCKLTVIENSAFCTASLTEVVIPEGVKVIKRYAFGVGTATMAYIPASVEEIQAAAFGYNEDLDNSFLDFIVDEDNENYCSYEHALYTKDKKTLVAYPGGRTDTEVIIPEGVTRLACEAFWHVDHIGSLVLPDSLEVIDNYAFEQCEISEITIPYDVTVYRDSLNTTYSGSDSTRTYHIHYTEGGLDITYTVSGKNIKLESDIDEYNYNTTGKLRIFGLYSSSVSVSAIDNNTGLPLTLSSNSFSNSVLSMSTLVNYATDLPYFMVVIPSGLTVNGDAEDISCTSGFAQNYGVKFELSDSDEDNSFLLKLSGSDTITLPYELECTVGKTATTYNGSSTDYTLHTFAGTEAVTDPEVISIAASTDSAPIYSGTYTGKVTFIASFIYLGED